MNRKSADRRGWSRIARSRFVAEQLEEPEFHGHVTLFVMDDVREPLSVPSDVASAAHTACIADAGHSWLQLFPDSARYTRTAMFDAGGALVQRYADVIAASGLDEHGVPWYDDLYLDVVLPPLGAPYLLDADELSETLHACAVSEAHCALAWEVAQSLLEELPARSLPAMSEDSARRELLLSRLTVERTG